jgi:hypothetical protein
VKVKIGILTFQKTTNYGAQLQCYALQAYIRKTFPSVLQCDVLQYRCKSVERVELPLIKQEIKTFKDIIKYILFQRGKTKRWKLFNQFTNKFICISSNSYDRNSVKQLDNIYDLFIVGSDQVWNVNITDRDYTYFLDFVDESKKKYSYAASFGYADIPSDASERCLRLLSEFEWLSVREDSAAALIDERLHRDADVVVDPTFLLSCDHWKNMCNYDLIQNKKYILVYFLSDNDSSCFRFIHNYAKMNNYKIIYVHNSIRIKNRSGMYNLKFASPDEFLGLLDKAQCVITGSFHGLCLSLILKKNFYYTLYGSIKGKNQSRIENLMERVNLQSRKIENGVCNDYSLIDYDAVFKLLHDHIAKSKSLLNNMIEKRLSEYTMKNEVPQ